MKTKNYFCYLLLTLLVCSSYAEEKTSWFSKLNPWAKKSEETVPAAETATSELKTKAAESVSSLSSESQTLLSTVTKQATQLSGLLSKSNPTASSDLTGALASLAGGKDADALGMVQSVAKSTMTNDQLSLATELKSNLEVLVLQKNFDANDPAIGGDVQGAIKNIQSKNYLGLAGNVNNILKKGELTPTQTALAKSLMGEYGQYLDTANSLREKAVGGLNLLKGNN